MAQKDDQSSISQKSSQSFLNEKYGSQLKKFNYFDVDIEPYKRQEIDSIIRKNIQERANAKARSPIFQQSDPICQGILQDNQTEVFKPTVKKTNLSYKTTFALTDEVGNNPNEYQWKSSLKKVNTPTKNNEPKRELKAVVLDDKYHRNPMI